MMIEMNYPQRIYAHPIDANIVRFLDNPVVNAVFRKIQSIAADGYFGQMIAEGIPVNEDSFSGIYKILNDCCDILRIPVPYTVVSVGADFNAYTLGSDKKPYIVLGSNLVKMLTKEQLYFVIGHECGHIAMGHVIYQSIVNILAALASTTPVIGNVVNSTAGLALNAWSRRSEISADRAGLLCCGNLETAQYALLQTGMGILNAEVADVHAYIEGSREYRHGGVLRKIGEYGASHPLTAKRIEALELFTKSSLVYRILGENSPEEAISDRELERRTEILLRVL